MHLHSARQGEGRSWKVRNIDIPFSPPSTIVLHTPSLLIRPSLTDSDHLLPLIPPVQTTSYVYFGDVSLFSLLSLSFLGDYTNSIHWRFGNISVRERHRSHINCSTALLSETRKEYLNGKNWISLSSFVEEARNTLVDEFNYKH